MAGDTKPLRIALVTTGDPADARVWSGTASHIRDALERRGELAHVVHRPWPPLRRAFGRAMKQLARGRWSHERSVRFMDWAAQPMLDELSQVQFDVVYAVATPFAAALAARFPTVVITDATACGVYGYYPGAPGIETAAARQAIASDVMALERALLWSVPSAWAARSLLEDFGAPPSKVVEIPFGANLAGDPMPVTKHWRGDEPLRLLFAGVDWSRKGGDVALAAADALRASGIDARLEILGLTATQIGTALPAFATVHGFIDKNSAQGRAQIDKLFSTSHVLLLPTRAEAYGLVFSEAAHNGVPSVSYATGGVTSVVRSGETGILLDPCAGPADFARAIERLISDGPAYAVMSQAARDDARKRLDWSVWAEQMAAATRRALAWRAETS